VGTKLGTVHHETFTGRFDGPFTIIFQGVPGVVGFRESGLGDSQKKSKI
jgi:hypothetical protein